MIREIVDGQTVVYETILQRRCDEPMADKKGYLPCEGGIKCKTCPVCLEQVDSGEWRHYDPTRRIKNQIEKKKRW